ncbi:hypothetical protein RYX36_020957 [Vicia faba]
MSNKFVALLLLSCIVSVQSYVNIISPAECFNYCYHAMAMPKIIAEKVCHWRCDNFAMYEAVKSGGLRGKIHDFSGPTASPASSPVL